MGKDMLHGDRSFLSKILFKGPEALKLFSDLSINSFSKFDAGQVKHIVQCNLDGKIIAECILMKMGEDRIEKEIRLAEGRFRKGGLILGSTCGISLETVSDNLGVLHPQWRSEMDRPSYQGGYSS